MRPMEDRYDHYNRRGTVSCANVVGLRAAKVRCSAALVDPEGWRHLAPGLAISWDERGIGRSVDGVIAGNCYRNQIP